MTAKELVANILQVVKKDDTQISIQVGNQTVQPTNVKIEGDVVVIETTQTE